MTNPFSKATQYSTHVFVGRSRELWGTLDRLANPQSRGSSALYGEAGIGKSWFLERIRHPYSHTITRQEGEVLLILEWEGEDPEVTIISVNCREIIPWTPEAFWRTVWQQLRSKDGPSSEQAVIDELLNNDTSDSLLIGRLLGQIAENGRFLILLLDNFDRVIKGVDPDNPTFLNTLRSLLVREDKSLGILLATTEPLHDLCKPINFHASPFDNVFYPVELKRFDEAEARDFIEVHLRDTDICFTQEERQKLFQVSQGHPDRLREACYGLFQEKSR